MPRHKEPARDLKLEQLRAFGLFIRGEHTLYQIAEALGSGFVERNPSTAAGRARTRIEQGWRLIRRAEVSRWERWWRGEHTDAAWQVLHGARLWTHPRREAELPEPSAVVIEELSPFARLLAKIAEAEQEARDGCFWDAANALRNLAAALRYQSRQEAAAEKKPARAKR